MGYSGKNDLTEAKKVQCAKNCLKMETWAENGKKKLDYNEAKWVNRGENGLTEVKKKQNRQIVEKRG